MQRGSGVVGVPLESGGQGEDRGIVEFLGVVDESAHEQEPRDDGGRARAQARPW